MKVISLLLALGCLLPGALRADARADYLAATEDQKAGRWAEAAQGYTKVTAQLPKYAAGWKQLATARYYLGDLEGAVASADRYLALQPQDSAFAAWADKLRAKLKLPPAATPVPSPVAATPAPTPAPEGLLYAAPPPGADAETVPLEAAAIINSQAASNIEQLEAQEADRSAEQMAEEAASILRQREPEHGAIKLGLRLMGGWALGLGSFKHGESVDSSTTPSSNPYDGQPAGGGAGLLELTAGFGDSLDFGLGVYPLLWSDSRKSSQTGTLTRSNSSEANAAFLPLMGSLTWRKPVTAGFSAIVAGGFGVIPSATVNVKSQTVQTSASGLSVTTVDGHLDYGLAPAWRAMVGGEWAVGPQLAFDLGLQLLGASFADAGGSVNVEVADETGATTFQAKNVAVTPQALQVMSLDILAGLKLRF